MGADIHGIIQGRYLAREPVVGGPSHIHDRTSPWSFEGKIEDDRNYAVFAVLAGVRNGTGFAGSRTHEPITPISEPRGLPLDLELDDDSYREYPDDPGISMGDHSFSWLLLSEILAYDWSQQFHRCGYIDREEYEKWDHVSSPSKWRGGINGPSIITADERGVVPENYTHICVYWSVPLSQVCEVFLKWAYYMAAKTKHYDEVRVVFGFDS